MALNLQTSPYYDDFDVKKDFHRILFKPGYAVQARELTQLQTILQEQIQRFGNFVFKDGSVVLGCAETFQFAVPYVKIEDGSITDAIYETYKTTLQNAIVTNELGVTARIILLEADITGQRVLYLNYLSASTVSGNEGVSEFSDNDTLTITTATSTIQITASASAATGLGSLFTIGDGLVYAQGTFIRHLESTKVLDYFTNQPTKNVGFRVIGESVNSDDDVTLLDPAAGSYNYTAPGADRYKLSTKLEVYNTYEAVKSGFYLLFNVENGKVKRAFNKPQYAELLKTLAERTYDESGNYSVSGLNVNIREHLKTSTNNGLYLSGDAGSASKLLYGVEPGKAYVEGYSTELKATEYLEVLKATDTRKYTEKLISTSFGNYVFVKSVQGDWDVSDDNLLVSLKNGGTTYATARVRLLKHYYGTPGTSSSSFYKLYLHSITLAGAYSLADLDNVTTITDGANNTCNVIITPGDALDVTQTKFKLHEAGINSLLFPTTERAVVAFDDNSTDYYYWKKFTVSNINPGIISLSPSEQWLVTGSLTDEDIKEYFIVVDDTTYNIVDFTGASGDITLTSTNGTLTLASPSVNPHTIYALVKTSNVNPIDITVERGWLKVDGSAAYSGASATNFASGKIYLGTSNAYDIEAIYEKVLETASGDEDEFGAYFPTAEAGLSSWTIVTDKFTLSENINDNFLDTSFVTYTGTAITTKKFVIKYRYFSRSTNTGYVNKNSYAGCLIDADPTMPITPPVGQDYKWIYTYQLPVYKSVYSGISYDLRDVIDFRPYKVNRTTSDQLNVAPTLVTTENEPTNFQTQIVVPDPDRELTATFSYNLPRIDKVILTRDGEFKVLKGVSSLTPQAPNDENHAMTLAQVNLAPYPSLSTYVAKQVGREDYASYVRLADNRRYTMRDIGSLESRISTLEYFAALSTTENKVANMVILEDPNDSTSAVMAKKGILVDNFDGHSVGNVFDTNYNAAIDTKKKHLRPGFTLENIDFELVSTANQVGNCVVTGASHTEDVFIQNTSASKSRICGNRILGNYKNGQLVLDPPQDVWVDVNTRPDVQANYQGNNDGWEYDNSPFTIHWNNWQTNWQGVEVNSIATLNVSIVNGITGTRSYNQSAQLVSDITRSMIKSHTMPDSNIRSIGVKVLDVSVVPFIRPQAITFIATGLLPNSVVVPTFDNEDVSDYCRYFSAATIEDVKNYKNPVLIAENTATDFGDDLIVNSDGVIIGQFRIPANKFRAGNLVFKLENTNGSSAAATQYFASGASSINDGTINSTRFPDIRQDALTQTQNAVIERLLLSNPGTFNASSYGDPMAQTFIVEGETDGVMVTSLDIYFKEKSETLGVTVQIREVVNGFPGNKIVPFSTSTKLASDVDTSVDATVATNFMFESPVYLKNNVEYAVVILPENNTTEYEVWVSELGQNILGTSERITQQPYVGVLYVPNNNTTWTALEAEDLKFTLYTGVFSTNATTVNLQSAPVDYITYSQTGAHDLMPGDVVSTSSGYEGYVMEVYEDTAKIYVETGTLAPTNTFIIDGTTFTVESVDDKTITALAPNFGTLTVAPTTSVQLTYKLMDVTGVRETDYTILANNETLELNDKFTLFSHSNRNNCIYMQATLVSNNESLSPILDLRKLSMLTIANNTTSVYTTRNVTLDGTADDLRVFLDVLLPEECDVTVKAKMLPVGSDSSFDDLSWTTLTTHAPATTNRLDFREYYYMVPAPFEYSKFAIRVDMTGSGSKVPLIKNLRAVALV